MILVMMDQKICETQMVTDPYLHLYATSTTITKQTAAAQQAFSATEAASVPSLSMYHRL